MKLFAALCCAAVLFAACDKTDEPKDPSTEQNGGNQNEDETPDPVTYTLTVLSSNEEMGTVTGGGSYEEGTEVTITATAERGFMFIEWNDENTDNPRVVTVTSDMTYTATFVAVPNGTENGHEWVDLGLPSGLKWATMNVGANAPEEYGDYFAWGETETKTDYSWDTYKFTTDGGSTFTKYNGTDGKTTLDPENDAAAVNWGGAWRMPTDAEWTELRDNCDWTWTDNYNGTGVAGCTVTGKNGNSIFLPAAGFRYCGNLNYAGSYGFYWSSSLITDDPSYAWDVYFLSVGVGRGSDGRCLGQSVRPVVK